MHGGMIVDATLIAAPSSTKNEKGECDPEMHQILGLADILHAIVQRFHSTLDSTNSFAS